MTTEIPSHHICVDIETLPGLDRPRDQDLEYPPPPGPITEYDIQEHLELTTPKRLKKVESINQWREDNREFAPAEIQEKWAKQYARACEEIDNDFDKAESKWKKEALDWRKGRIYCVAIALGEEDPLCICLETEKETLQCLSTILVAHEQKLTMTLLPYGHNYAAFDGVWLWKKALYYHLHDLARICRPGKWGRRCGDTMTLFMEDERPPKNRISMDALAQWMGLGGKTILEDEYCDAINIPRGSELNGGLVLDLVEADLGHVVTKYCQQDVRTTREIWRTLKAVV